MDTEVLADLWGNDEDAERVRVPIEGTPSLGAEHPLVTLVVFTDFQCPFCARALPTLKRLIDAHPQTLQVRFRHLPLEFHSDAQLAAEAAEEARAQGGDGAFWAFHNWLFANQNHLDRQSLVAHAGASGLDAERMNLALRGRVHRERVEADAEMADEIGVRGTPTFFLNGRALLGARPHSDFEAAFEEELNLAQRAIAAGLPRAQIYAQAIGGASPRLLVPTPPQLPAGRRVVDRGALYRVPAGSAPQRGSSDALVTLVVFSDFQCPFCGRLNRTLEALAERYRGQLRVLFRHMPLAFHQQAGPAAEAAEEARAQLGEAGFWQMHDRLFSAGALSPEALREHARALGLDLQRFDHALSEHMHAPTVEADSILARRLGVRGTPATFVNGQLLTGAQRLPVFVEAVDAALQRASVLISEGVPRAEVYAALMRTAASEARWVQAPPTPSRRRARPERGPVHLSVPAGAPSRGADSPALTIQVFSDFQCPFCGRVVPTLARLLEAFPQVNLVFRHYPLPFHNRAIPAAIASMEVQRQLGDPGFWAFHDLLFENQRQLSHEDLVGYARAVGADPAQVSQALSEGRFEAEIEAEIEVIRAALPAIGTPSFLIGDQVLSGALPYAEFETAVREQLSRGD